MNMKCASWCITFLKTYTRNNNIITHIRQGEYEYIMSDIIEAIWLNIGTRSEEFKIKQIAKKLELKSRINKVHCFELCNGVYPGGMLNLIQILL